MADNTIKITALLNTEDLEKKLLHIQGTLTQLVNNLNNAFSANTFLLKDFFGYMDKNVTQYINAFTRLSRMMETSFAPSVRKAIGVMKLSPEDVSSYSNMAQDLVKNARLINQIFGASPQVGFFSSSLKTQLADFEKLKKDIDIMQEVSRRRISPSIFGDIYTGDVGKARFKADLEERKAMLSEYQKNMSAIQRLQPFLTEAPKTGDILGRVTSYTSSLQTLRKEVEIMQRALEKGSPLEMLSERYAGVGGRDRFLEDLQSRQEQLAQLEKYQKQVSRFKDILAEPIPIGRFKASADEYIATINKLNSDISVMTRALEKNAPLRVFGEQFAGKEGRTLFQAELQSRQQQLQSMIAPGGFPIDLSKLKAVGADISDVPLRYVQGWSKVLVLNEKLNKATQELITTSKSATFNWANIATRAIFLVSVLGSVFTALEMVKRGFTEGVRAIEDYRVSVAKFTGLTVTFTTPKEGEAFSTHLAKATVYAEKLYEFMQDIAAETLLNNEQAQLMAQSFLQAGIIIDTTSEKQKEAVKSIGNAILILTKGQQGSVQIVQELRDLFVSGMITSRDMLGVLLRAIDPQIKEKIQEWKKQGSDVLLVNVGETLKGINTISTSLEQTLTVRFNAAMVSIQRVGRAAFVGLYDTITSALQGIETMFSERRYTMAAGLSRFLGNIITVVTTVFNFIKSNFDILVTTAKATFAVLLSMFTGILFTKLKKQLVAIVGTVLFSFVYSLIDNFIKFQKTISNVSDELTKLGRTHTKLEIELSLKQMKLEDTEFYKDFMKMPTKVQAMAYEQGLIKTQVQPTPQEIQTGFGMETINMYSTMIEVDKKRIYELEEAYNKANLTAKNSINSLLSSMEEKYSALARLQKESGTEKITTELQQQLDTLRANLGIQSNITNEMLTQLQLSPNFISNLLELHQQLKAYNVDIIDVFSNTNKLALLLQSMPKDINLLTTTIDETTKKPIMDINKNLTEQQKVSLANTVKKMNEEINNLTSRGLPQEDKIRRAVENYMRMQQDILTNFERIYDSQLKKQQEINNKIIAMESNAFEIRKSNMETQMSFYDTLRNKDFMSEVNYLQKKLAINQEIANQEIELAKRRAELEIQTLQMQSRNAQELRIEAAEQLSSLFKNFSGKLTGVLPTSLQSIAKDVVNFAQSFKEGFDTESIDTLNEKMLKFNRTLSAYAKTVKPSETLSDLKNTVDAILRSIDSIVKYSTEQTTAEINIEVKRDTLQKEINNIKNNFEKTKFEIEVELKLARITELNRLFSELYSKNAELYSLQAELGNLLFNSAIRARAELDSAIESGKQKIIDLDTAIAQLQLNIETRTSNLTGLSGEDLDREQNYIDILKQQLNSLTKRRDVQKQVNEATERDLAIAKWGTEDIFKAFASGMYDVSKGWTDSLQNIVDSTKAITNSMIDAFTNFFDSTTDGFFKLGRLAESILNTIYRELLQALVLKPIIGGISSLVTGATAVTATIGASAISSSAMVHSGGLIMHSGGVVPSFHSGGLSSDEVPAILQKGEYVVSRKGVQALDAINSGNVQSGGVNVSVNVQNNTGFPIDAKISPTKWNGKQLVKEIILELKRTDPAFNAELARRF